MDLFLFAVKFLGAVALAMVALAVINAVMFRISASDWWQGVGKR